MKKSYKIEVDCANCAMKMEEQAAKVAGVKQVTVHFILQKIMVEFAEGCDPQAVMADVLRVCRKVEPDCSIEF